MSRIQWTDATWNPVIGCTPVSEGCRNCYAAGHARRMGGNPRTPYYEGLARTAGDGRAVFTGVVRTMEDRLDQPLRWTRPRRVFVNSMSDLFHPDVPFEFVDRVFAVMALADRHTFQVLTKRPERMAEYLGHNPTGRLNAVTHARVARAAEAIARSRGEDTAAPYWDVWLECWPLPNVWLGTSVEDQTAADERIPHLLRCPAAVRFLSCEPLLGPVDLRSVGHGYHDALTSTCCPFCGEYGVDPCPPCRNGEGVMVDWIIAGGESGPRARPCNVGWIRSIVDQCREAGVPVFVKQLGADPRVCYPSRSQAWPDSEVEYEAPLHDPKGGNPEEWPEDLRVREWPEGVTP